MLKKIRLNDEEPIKENTYQTSLGMKALNIMGITTDITLIALAGIAVATTASVSIQTGNATDVVNTTNLTTEEAIERNNNYTNVTLGNLFYSAKTHEETYNPVNQPYAVISYVYNVTLMPPNATTTLLLQEL